MPFQSRRKPKTKTLDSFKNELFQMAKMAKTSRAETYVHMGDPQWSHGPPAVGDAAFSHTSTIFISKADLNKSPWINSWRSGLKELSTKTIFPMWDVSYWSQSANVYERNSRGRHLSQQPAHSKTKLCTKSVQFIKELTCQKRFVTT